MLSSDNFEVEFYMPRGRDLWLPREMRLVSDYLVQFYPGAIHYTRIRLGTYETASKIEGLTESEQRLLGSFRRWADAIAVTDHELIVIEGAIRPDTGEASKLLTYADLVPHTPELREYLNREIRMELVVVVEDPVVTAMCRRFGIRVVVFRPEWLKEYFDLLEWRERRPPQRRGV